MNIFPESINVFQPPRAEAEGLPYWILWLLIFVILLLVVFIFLRDKDLRRRLNNFFFGARKRFNKLRLQVKLRKEKRLRQEILQELGESAWKEKIGLDEDKEIWKRLKSLEEKKKVLQNELREVEGNIAELNRSWQIMTEKFKENRSQMEKEKVILSERINEICSRENEIIREVAAKNQESEIITSKINSLQEELMKSENDLPKKNEKKSSSEEKFEERINELQTKKEEIEAVIKQNLEEKEKWEKELSKLKNKVQELDRSLGELEEDEKSQTQRINKELKEWEKVKNKLLKSLNENKKQKQPLFVELGNIFEKTREEFDSFVVFYSQLDRINKSIKEIERKLEEL